MFLLIVIFAIFDSRNLGVPRGLEPVVIGFLIVTIASSLGMNSGCAMNPARDLSPRLFTALAGWVHWLRHQAPNAGDLVNSLVGELDPTCCS